MEMKPSQLAWLITLFCCLLYGRIYASWHQVCLNNDTLKVLEVLGEAQAGQNVRPADPPTGARTEGPSPAAQGLTVVAHEGVEAIGPHTGRYAFGTIAPGETQPLEQTFTLRNDGKSAVVIDHIEPSCGCVSATPDATTLAPGAQTGVQVSVDVPHLHPGPSDLLLWVFVKGSAQPAATLEVTVTLPASVAFFPPVLAFGRVPAGVSRSRTLTATLAPPLWTADAPPRLVSSNPDVEVRAKINETATAYRSDPSKPLVYTYTVRLSPQARLGALTGSLTLVPASDMPRRGSASASTAAEMTGALGGVSVPITAEVVGKISAMPAAVVFGTVVAGRQATRRVTLIGTSSRVLARLKVRCALPHLSATLVRAHPGRSSALSLRLLPRPGHIPGRVSTPPATLWLDVTLDARLPPGLLTTRVLVTTADGERLELPVTALLVKSKAK